MNLGATRFAFLVTGPEVGHINLESACYTLPHFPPPDDFPVMIDLAGDPVSRYGDDTWRVGKQLFNFGAANGKGGPKGAILTGVNRELLKRCLCWFMYGERRSVSVSTLAAYHTVLKAIFAFCSNLERPISASNLSRYFDHLEIDLAQNIRPSSAKAMGYLLHELWDSREALGFELLRPDQIARIRQSIPDHRVQQTQCIPPRIWTYQAERMGAFLGDFVDHKAGFESLLFELLEAYRRNYGDLAKARTGCGSRSPCFAAPKNQVKGCTYLGSFTSVAQSHGVYQVLRKWVSRSRASGELENIQGVNVQLLSKLFNAVGMVGMAYIQCFSGMRISEAISLRCDCLTVERDPLLGDIHILSGETGKTIQDEDARWLAAPSVALAVEAMSIVARWRTSLADELGFIPLTDEDKINPYLLQRSYEPWVGGKALISMDTPTALRPDGYQINKWLSRVPGLFDSERLRVEAEDELFVRQISSNADLSKYGEGNVWPLSSHQYRRTAAVMMACSKVTIEAQQYQFKHLSRNQSAYYRRGAHSLRLNRTLSNELLEARYELVSLELKELSGPEYVSPISVARKNQILKFHEIESGDAIQAAIRKGHLSVKQTLFGVCTRRDKCPFGGHDNYAHCPNCYDALLSKKQRRGVESLGKEIAVRLVDVPAGTPLRAQLERNASAIRRFLDVTE